MINIYCEKTERFNGLASHYYGISLSMYSNLTVICDISTRINAVNARRRVGLWP